MGKQEPDTVPGNSTELSGGGKYDPASKRAQIAVIARNKPKEVFSNLMHHLTYDLVRGHLEKISNKSAAGVDGMTKEEAIKNLDWILPPILDAIHQGHYDAPPVRRVYIPKANGGERPIGVPAIIDRAIQAATATILNQIYEQDFLASSFGFRPGLSCHHALATINELIFQKYMPYVLEVDIRDFFGSLSHEWLRKFLKVRIGDERVLKLVDSWLRAGVMENGRVEIEEVGTPQGGSISPILSNIYLHYVLDLWFEKKIKKQLTHRSGLVRYADDFSILFCREVDMKTVKTLLIARLSQFGLTIADDKSHMTNLTPRANRGKDRRRMTFLGFSIYREKIRNGNGYRVAFLTESKRFSRAKRSMKQKLSAIKHFDLKQQAETINAILVGHYNYYGFVGNSHALSHFRDQTIRYWRRCLFRRSQQEMTWIKFRGILEKYPLKPARVRVRYADIGALVRL